MWLLRVYSFVYFYFLKAFSTLVAKETNPLNELFPLLLLLKLLWLLSLSLKLVFALAVPMVLLHNHPLQFFGFVTLSFDFVPYLGFSGWFSRPRYRGQVWSFVHIAFVPVLELFDIVGKVSFLLYNFIFELLSYYLDLVFFSKSLFIRSSCFSGPHVFMCFVLLDVSRVIVLRFMLYIFWILIWEK